MVHKIAVLVYGQPRMISETMKWRAAFWKDVAAMTSVEIQIDWYYHLWDGVNGNQLFVDNTDISDYYVSKRKSIDGEAHWISNIYRIHPSTTINQILNLHEEYGLSIPFFSPDEKNMSYEKIVMFYKRNIEPLFNKFSVDMASDATETYWIKKFLEHHANHHLVKDVASFISAGSVMDLFKVLTAGEQKYDTVMMCRTDSIIKPSLSQKMAAVIEDFNDHWDNPPGVKWYADMRVEVANVLARNDLAVWYHDFHIISSQHTMEYIWDNWVEKLAGFEFRNATKKLLQERYSLPPIADYNIHAIPSMLATLGKIVSFNSWNGVITDQTVIRQGLNYNDMECNDENFLRISGHFAYTQGAVRPYV